MSTLFACSLGLGASWVVLSAVSCKDNSGYALTGGTGGTGGATTSSTTSGTGASGVGGLDVDGGACEVVCSNDLKKIVDCHGTVLEECPSDKGCHNAECIDNPCQAAELSKSSYGCDYWALKTGLLPEAKGACFAAFVANTWSTPVFINVEYDGVSLPVDFAYIPTGQGTSLSYEAYDPAIGLGVGEVAILFLARNEFGFVIDCPKPAAIATEVGVEDTGRGKAFHITTDKPVVAYQILPYGGGPSAFSSATLLLPTSAWDTNYIAVNAYKNGTINTNASPLIDILAHEDNTTVTILPKVNIVGGTNVEPATANVKKEYTLQKGEFIQIEQPEELTGSPIQSDKPVGVWGGQSCLFVPLDKNACDSAQQQIPPVKALGNEYAAVRYRGRQGGMDESVPWRIVGAVNGTQLTWHPSTPPGAPEMIDRGTVVEFSHPGPFTVKSLDDKHPFYISGYMTGGELYDSEGDPDWVNVVPPAQYLDHYVLFTDPTYPETNIVVIRKPHKSDNKFRDVTLDCLGTLQGWQPIGTDGLYEYTRVDLVSGNFQDQGNCSNGRHEMESEAPFGVTVWGWGSTAAQGTKLVSYAYPAGASVQPINDVTVLPEPE
ncbi:MAG: IgGFc-binding protein [Polyangiaceae bacterium]|nr:IgGFc-binding protein [Polyangiaceae bacterium]